MLMSKLQNKVIAGAAIALAAGAAMADTTTFDPTATVSVISGTIAAVTAIGGACLGVVVVAKTFTWVRSALK